MRKTFLLFVAMGGCSDGAVRPLPLPELEDVAFADLDGTRLMFTRVNIDASRAEANSARYVIDGPDATVATYEFVPDAVLSPDGSRMAYNAYDGGADIGVANLDGSEPKRIATGFLDSQTQGEPAWSADGARILFTARPHFDGQIQVPASIRSVSPQGGAARVERSFPALSTPMGCPTSAHQKERVSQSANGGFVVACYNELWTATPNADDAPLRVHTAQQGWFLMAPVWAPDGQRIGFFETNAVTVRLRVLDLATGSVVTLDERTTHQSSKEGHSLCWSPNGATIVYVWLVAPNRTNLFTVKVPGGVPRQLTTRAESLDRSPSCA